MGEIKINPGEFNSLVFLYGIEKTRTPTGEIDNKYANKGKCFAKVEAKTLDEKLVDNRICLIEFVEVTTYANNYINNGWRLRIDVNMYEILSIRKIDNLYAIITAKQI